MHALAIAYQFDIFRMFTPRYVKHSKLLFGMRRSFCAIKRRSERGRARGIEGADRQAADGPRQRDEAGR